MFARRAKALFEETGRRLPVPWISGRFNYWWLYFLFGFRVATSFDEPVLGSFNFKGGGQLPCHFSPLVRLTLYTSAFIAENVRAGSNPSLTGKPRQPSHLGCLEKIQLIWSQSLKHCE